MASPDTLEKRVAILEAEVARLKGSRDSSAISKTPWWEEIRGKFKDPAYEEAMRYGREYRESLRPSEDCDNRLE
ncbi:MAG: hypothetical protein ACLQVD_20380 [Capsulimonadaceae bacterium]